MAVRTTEDAVGGIIVLDSTLEVTSSIETANAIVNDNCLESDYTDEKLELIERWLAAHFYSLALDPRAASEKAGSVGQSFQVGQLGYMLQFTQYGQTALTLDTAGDLAALSKAAEDGIKRRTRIIWLGPECD